MAPYDPELHHRRSLRQPGKDYSAAGIYFVTINTQQRVRLFGQVRDRVMRLSEGGRVVESCWLAIPSFYPSVVLHSYVVMPDHFHGLVELLGPSFHAPPSALPEEPLAHRFQATVPKSLGAIIRSFKSGVTQWYHTVEPELQVWQRNFHEVEIEDAAHYQRVWDYIRDNPAKWTGGELGCEPWEGV